MENTDLKPIVVDYEIEREEKNGNLTAEKKKVSVPQKVADLNKSQFIALAQLYFAPFRRFEHKYYFLMELMQLEKKDFLAIEDEVIFQCEKLILPFLKEEPISKKSIFNSFTHQKTEYQGPSNQLLNFLLDEFILCELLYGLFLKNRDMETLNQFCAAAYRPKGMKFEDYEQNEEYLIAEMKAVDLPLKYAAFFNYMALRNFFTKKFWRVFNSSGSNKTKVDNGWRGTVVSLAGEKFGHPEKVRKSLLHDVMVHIDDNEKSRKRK